MCVCICEHAWHMHGHTPWKARGHHQVFVIRYYLPLDLRLTSLPRLTGQPASSLQEFYILSLKLHTCATNPGFLHGCWETELRFLYLCGKFFTDWAVFLARIRAHLRRFCSSCVNWSPFTHNLVSFLWCKIVSFFLVKYLQKYNPSFSTTGIKQKAKIFH